MRHGRARTGDREPWQIEEMPRVLVRSGESVAARHYSVDDSEFERLSGVYAVRRKQGPQHGDAIAGEQAIGTVPRVAKHRIVGRDVAL